MIDLMKYLSENPYPGRGILMGRTAMTFPYSSMSVGSTAALRSCINR